MLLVVMVGGLVMDEAVKTTASAGEVWTICVVAVCCLAFWLGMVAWADKHPVWRGRRVADMQGPVLGGMHLGSGGRSVAPNREAPSVLTNVDDVPYDERDYEPEHDIAAQWTEAAPGMGEAWVPVQRGAEPRPAGNRPRQPEAAQAQPTAAQPETGPAAAAMPGQRTGEADRAERSVAGGGADRQGDDEEHGAAGNRR